MSRPLLIAGLVVLALTIGAVFMLVSSNPGRPLQVGDKAPDFHLKGAFGGEGELSDLEGKVIVLNFWATWCAPCIEEMPALQKLYRTFEGDDFEIVGVSLDREGADVVSSFAERHRLTFSLVIDPDNETESLYRLTGLPETYIIDKDRVIRHKVLGPRDWANAEHRKLVSDLLGRGPTSRRRAGAPITEPTAPGPVTNPSK